MLHVGDGFSPFTLIVPLQIGLFYSVGDDALGSRVPSEPVKGYSPLEDPDLSKIRDTPLGVNPGVPDVKSDRPVSKSSYDGLPISAADSNILFVGGLPKDCTRREVGRILCCLCVSLYVFVYLFLFLAWHR